jgi:chitinase
VLLMLSVAGWSADALRAGGYDAQLSSLATAIAGTGVTVFVAPLYEGNDWRLPWSPLYGSTSPGYDSAQWSQVGSSDEYKLAFDRVVRQIRAGAPLARFVWVASVETQPSVAGNDWSSYYPGAVADVIMLKGLNYGNGPAQGGGATVWQTASEIFDTAYTTAAALHASKPIWLYTASHEPSATYAPVGPGFSAGATMSIDSTHSKATWLTDLLYDTDWPRVTVVALYGISDTRNWSLTSTTGASSALSATVDHSWALTQITQDQMGDYVRDSTAKFATWLRSGSQPATRTNEYARPDAAVAGGTRGSLVFGLPYSPGDKTSVSITVADMLKWNTIHGELLRQCARNGMQGWAFGSGVMAPSDPMTLYGGSNVGGRTVLESANDPQPGPKMQVEGGQKAAEGGTIVTPPTSTPAAPSGALVTTAAPGYDSAQTQLQLDWAPPTQLNGSTLTGYKFFASGPGAFTPEWVSGVYDPPGGANPAPDPFIFTNMVADTSYTVGVVATSNNGDGARRTVTGKTAVAPPPPPPSASGLPNPLRGVYHMTHIQNAYNDSALARFNFFFHSFAHGRSSDGFIPNEAPSEANGYKGVEHIYSGMKAHIDALDAETPSRKVVLSIGGAGDSTQCTLATELTMFNSLVSIIDTHGFKGVDFDLEAAANYTADGLRAVSARLKKKYGGNFTITCAPGPNNATYRAFAATPAGWSHPTAGVIYNGILCDAIMPQFYDWSATDASRKQSMYDEVNAILGLGVPASRIVIGGALPWGSYLGYNCDSCPFNGNGTGGNAPQVFIDAYNTLKGQSKQIRGLFIWDSGHDQNPSNWSTATTANNLGSSGSWKFRDALWTNLPNP